MSGERTIELTETEWEAVLAGLYERDETLGRRVPGAEYPPEEEVDPYVLSAHAEALRSAEIDGDVWGTLADIEEEAGDEEAAWAKIVAFYLGRGCVLVRVTEAEEPEEWIFAEELAGRLGLGERGRP